MQRRNKAKDAGCESSLMNILAFDTSSAACSVALQKGDQVGFLHKVAPLQQGRLILTMIQTLLDSFSLTLKELDAIAYGCGPGSFTGIRIAASVAQGFGLVTKLPIIPISSLAVLAQTAFLERQWPRLFVALDARMEQVYWAMYEVNHQRSVELIGEEGVCHPDQISLPHDKIKNRGLDWYGVGDGWDKYGEKLMRHRPLAVDSAQLPNARALLILAKTKLDRGDWVGAAKAIPIYLR